MRRPLIAIGVLAALLAVGFVVATARGDTASESADVHRPAEPEVPGTSPTRLLDVPSPEAAAIAAVAMTGEVARSGFISRRELIESFATPSFGPVLADATSKQMTALLLEFSEREVDPADLQVTEQPLRVRIAASTNSAAASRGLVGTRGGAAGCSDGQGDVANGLARSLAGRWSVAGRWLGVGPRAHSDDWCGVAALACR